MTENEKRIYAQRLFDGIGLIDDRFIAEAQSPYAPPRRGGIFKRILISAVSLSLVLCVAVGIFVIGKMGQKGGADADIPNEGIENGEGSQSTSLSGRLLALRTGTDALRVKESELRLFESSPSVIWKYTDEEEYRVRRLTSVEVEQLKLLYERDAGSRVSDGETDSGIDGLWIAIGDGRIVSPYLEQTAGNIGYGELFDYAPEYEPSAECSEYLCDVIS